MNRVLSGSKPEALSRRESVGYVPLTLEQEASESELQIVIEAVYRQLLTASPLMPSAPVSSNRNCAMAPSMWLDLSLALSARGFTKNA